jgi:uncharacterized protein YbjT (DUF2867 family)
MSGTPAKKLLILGASGRTGRHLAQLALDEGYRVRAFVRDPKRLGLEHPALEVFQGDMLDGEAVRRAVRGCDAVLSALGRDGKDVRPLLEGTKHLVAAMKEAGVARLVCMSSMGAGSTAQLAGPLLNAMIGLFGLRRSFDAKGEQERWLFESGLDVSLMFAGTLTEGPATGQPQVTSVAAAPRSNFLPPKKVSRADVAGALLAEVAAHQWAGRPSCVVGP